MFPTVTADWSFLSNSPCSFYAALVGVPAVILAMVQSYRLFGAQNRGNSRSVARNLLPLASLVFLCGFSWTALDAFWWRAGSQAPYLIAVTSHAVEKRLPSAAKLHPTEPLQLTGDDVANAQRWPIAEGSILRWLSGARIIVTPDPAHPGGFYCQEHRVGYGIEQSCYFSATIHLADGTDITETYTPLMNRSTPMGGTAVHVRWPGATTEEPLWDR